MKKPFILCLMLFSFSALAADQTCENLRSAVLTSAYSDMEFRAYVCTNEEECSIENLSKLIDIELVELEQIVPKHRYCEFFVTPKSKGKQYPTLVFAGDHTKIQQVLSDYENGLSIAESGSHGMRDLFSQARPTPEQLVKTTYTWDGGKYFARKTKCFKIVIKDSGRLTTLLPRTCK